MKLPLDLRWAIVPVASIAACTGTVFVADVVSGGGARMMTPEAGRRMEAVIPVEFRAGLVYAIAAVAWVIAGTYVAPRHRRVVAVALYIAGACLAWFELNDWYIPEGYPRAYQHSRVPLVLTLAGGLIAVVIIAIRRWRTSSHVR